MTRRYTEEELQEIYFRKAEISFAKEQIADLQDEIEKFQDMQEKLLSWLDSGALGQRPKIPWEKYPNG